MRSLFITALIGILTCFAPAAHAGGQLWEAASDDRLADLRGGFAAGPGLMVSFGIVRTVQIDGLLVSQSSLHVADLRSISPEQARQIAAQLTTIGSVQTGSGNATVVHNAIPGPLVIQNTGNDRRIQAVTELNIVSNGMGLLKNINLGRTLSDALGASVR